MDLEKHVVNENKKEKINTIKSVRWTLVWYDLAVYTAISLWMLVFVRNESIRSAEMLYQWLFGAVSIFSFRFIFNVYRQIWRYGGIQSYIRILVSDGCSYVLYYTVQWLVGWGRLPFADSACIFCFTLLMALAMRMIYRYAYKCCKSETFVGKFMELLVTVFAGRNVRLDDLSKVDGVNVAIIGAGRVGVMLAEELLNNENSAYIPKCFVDISPDKIGREIYGMRVFGESETDGEMLSDYGIREVIFALPQLGASEKKKLYDRYIKMGCKVKVYDYPTVSKADTGKRMLREFDIEELLFRKSIDCTDENTGLFYKDKTVLITGGGGSIGSELCRQCAKAEPKKIIVLDIYENGAYDIQQELRIVYGDKVNIQVEIVSVCNREGLKCVFEKERPQIVICAAAHKHVTLMEHNCAEAVRNNIFGTLNTVELAQEYGSDRVMLVSTDKAVNPTNVMGATKRMCEMIVACYGAMNTGTKFSATRFGNVLGSAGSVVPLFKKQILSGGPVTVTDKRIIRYFMTVPEASQLVLQSGAMAKNGELFVLDMGEPVKILDLAENMIRLNGLEPYKDIEITETGLRPGEKLYEELLIKDENLSVTENKLIFIERDTPISKEELDGKLDILREALNTQDDEKVREALKKVVSTYVPNSGFAKIKA